MLLGRNYEDTVPVLDLTKLVRQIPRPVLIMQTIALILVQEWFWSEGPGSKGGDGQPTGQ